METIHAEQPVLRSAGGAVVTVEAPGVVAVGGGGGGAGGRVGATALAGPVPLHLAPPSPRAAAFIKVSLY